MSLARLLAAAFWTALLVLDLLSALFVAVWLLPVLALVAFQAASRSYDALKEAHHA